VTQQQDIRQVIDRTLAEYGSIEILVNNAGIGILGPFGDAGLGDYEATMNVNLRSVFLFCHYVLPLMAKAGRGDVVNIASISGLQAFAGASLYCASKFATIGMTRALDNEYRGLGVRVSSVCPAGTRTQWAVGTGRTQEQANQEDLLSPETVANAVLFAIKQPENARMGELVLYPMSEPGWL
jgi:3-oxoacyl-[acyl-carrier protein] reductase